MKFSKAYKYQLTDVKVSLVAFYIVFFVVEVSIIIISQTLIKSPESSIMSGVDFSTPVFLFVMSLCIFSTNLNFFNQNSVSRRTMVLSCFAMFATVAAIMLAVDAINAAVFYIGDFFDKPYTTFYEMTFHQFESPDHKIVDKTSDILVNLPTASDKFIRVLVNLVFNYIAYITATVTGFFISVVFYRLSNFWRVILFVIIPVTLLNSAWSIYKLGRSFFDSISRWMDKYIFNNTTGAIITMLIWTVVFAALSYLVANRAALKARKE